MDYSIKTYLLLISCVILSFPLYAHEHPEHEVTPKHERDHANQIGETGPKNNQGIKSVATLGSVDLSQEFPNIGNRELRARVITIEPGGVVAVHQHQQRPGLAYILDGEIIEHRNDHPAPLVRKSGEVAFENSGVIHWWENRSDKEVRALVVDIIESK